MSFLKRILVNATALISVLIFAGCTFDGGSSKNDPVSLYGSLIVSQGGARSLDKDTITACDITVLGDDIEPIVKTDVVLNSGYGEGIKIKNIRTGKNRVVVVQAKETIENVYTKMAGVSMSAVTDINPGNNSVLVNWESTKVGEVFNKLIELKYDGIDSLSVETVKSYLPENIHAALIDADGLANDIKNNCVKSGDSYKIDSATVTFTSDSAISNVEIMVCDPVSEKVTSLVAGKNTISNVAPGTWKVYGLLNGSTVIFNETITVGAGEEIDLGLLSLKVPSPRLEDSTGKQISQFITGSTKVYLKARSMDDESQDPGISIYYTLDGTEPTASSNEYTDSGITVNVGSILKAVAIDSGFGKSEVVSWTFKRPTLGEQHPSTGDYSVASTSGSAATGATISGDKTSFVLYSKNATKVLLEIYENAYGDATPLHDYWMTKDSNNYWRVTVNGNLKNAIYAFRCWGPNWTYSDSWTRGGSSAGFKSDCDSNGNRFNPNKVLFDPYAKEMTHDKSNPAVLGTKTAAIYTSGATNRNIDTAAYAPKAYVVSDSTDFGVKPGISSAAARVYEAHVRGLTKHTSASNLTSILSGIEGFEGVENVPEAYRGTYKGAGYMANYLKGLGINTIEFLPVHESDNDCNPDDKAGGNYWAYMTYGFFAPDRRYAYDKSAGGPTREFKEMVKAFHDAGIEVYLDVVYNHTGEGGTYNGSKDSYQQAEITFMRGIDNSTYYELGSSGLNYWETSGCGNNMHCDNSTVRKLIIDSLSYWITDMGVDGFRFDLAPVLGRVENNHDWGTFSSSAQTLVEIGNLGKANNVEMIAEAWDCSWPSGYQVGNFPSGWGDWNGVYRDVIRKLVGGSGTNETKSDNGRDLYNLNATSAIYGHNGNGGADVSGSKSLDKFGVSVNMVVAHDGFTLADLSSYSGAGNARNATLAWPFGPSDGGNGDQNAIPGSSSEVYRRTARNYIALQMFTRGIPMIVLGDEFSRTQNGNNNAYNLDSYAIWNNYNMINTKSPHTVSTGGSGSFDNKFGTFNNTKNRNGNFIFMQRMLKMHSDPAFTQLKHTDATTTWIEGGSSNYFGYTTDGTKFGGHKFAMITNQTSDEKSLTIPAPSSGYQWVRICDTGSWAEKYENSWDPNDATAAEYYAITGAKSYGVGAYSTVIFEQVKIGGEVETCAAPSISGTTPFTGSTSVTITCGTSGADIYYTTDGSTPSASSTKYTGAFFVSATTTVKAIAVKSGYNNSSVATKQFKLDVPTCADPVISGTTPFKDSTSVTISCGTSGATIYYTLDGKVPTTSSSVYSGAITLTASKTVKAIAVKSGLENSDVVSKSFTLQTVSSKSAVMLQGFTWNSAPRGTSWNKENPSPYWYKWYGIMKNNAAAIKDTFDYVWFNPPSICDASSSEGYAPTELNNLNSYYGTASELKEVIQAIQPAKALADIVVNHRAGTTCWGDFTNPSWGVVKGSNYTAICSDDEGFASSGDSHMIGKPAGNPDTGATYGAYRDIDHTQSVVQQGIIDWMNDVLKPAGFVGWRYDYVKGFGGEYVGKYNKGSSAEFSVGEYWPTAGYSASNPSAWGNEIKGWITNTASNGGQRSRAFDFALKGALNAVFGCTWNDGGSAGSYNYGLLADSSNLYISQPSDAVTFIDNHDTGSNQGHWELNRDSIGVGYALILTHPGVPCVAWSHYFTFAEGGNGNTTYPYSGLEAAQSYIAYMNVAGTTNTLRQHIDYLINLRKEVGIEYDSDRVTKKADGSGYAAEITGENGSLIVLIGNGYTPSDSEYEEVYSGTNFKIWKKGGSGVKTCKTPVISISGGKATITCGTSGATIKYGFSSSAMNSTYNSPVTVSEGQTIYAYATCGGYEDSGVASKECTAKVVVMFANNQGWSKVCAYFFDVGTVGEAWPGTEMTYVGTVDGKSNVYSIEVPDGATKIIFNNNNQGVQTVNINLTGSDTRYELSSESSGKWNVSTW